MMMLLLTISLMPPTWRSGLIVTTGASVGLAEVTMDSFTLLLLIAVTNTATQTLHKRLLSVCS